MALYTFVLENFHIDNTRSRHQDTDEVVFGLQVGTHVFPLQWFSAGDVNNGDHGVSLAYRSVFISDSTSPVTFSYEIFNGDASKLATSLDAVNKKLLATMIDDTVKTSGTTDTGFPNFSSGEAGQDVPNPNNKFDDTSDWTGLFLQFMENTIGSILFPDCDGFVAADAIGRTKAQWDSLIDAGGGSTFRQSMHYPGSDSPGGCGSNSDYTVTWSVTRARAEAFSLRQFLQDNHVTLTPGLRSFGPGNISVRELMGLFSVREGM
jgi:hypothetical protein